MYPYMSITAAVIISVYVCIFWSERHVMRQFRILNASMSPSAKRLHTDVHNVLVALAVCLIISMMVPSNVFLIALTFRINMGLVSPFLLVMITSVTFLNPITTCYFVRPFRRYVSRALFLTYLPHLPRIGSISTTVERSYAVNEVPSTMQ